METDPYWKRVLVQRNPFSTKRQALCTVYAKGLGMANGAGGESSSEAWAQAKMEARHGAAEWSGSTIRRRQAQEGGAEGGGDERAQLEKVLEDVEEVEREASTPEGLEGVAVELEQREEKEEVAAVLEGGKEGLRERIEAVEERLREAELGCVQEYAGEAEELEGLRAEAKGCEEELGRLEGMLSGFQGKLGQLAGEIKTLQESSMSLSVRLRNRREAERELGKVVEELTAPPELAKEVAKVEPTSDEFGAALRRLGVKLDSLQRARARDPPPVAAEDAAPLLERLRRRAAGKCKEALTERFARLRKPRTNVQVVQQAVLAPLSPLARFMGKHAQEEYWECMGSYCQVVGKVLRAALTSYQAALSRKRALKLGKGELLGTRPLSDGPSPAQFGQHGRGEALGGDASASPVVVSQLEAGEGQQELSWEEAFRSCNKLLMDCATSEYLFCSDFWAEAAAEAFESSFGGALAAFERAAERDIDSCHDPVALIAAARCCRAHQSQMAERAVPALDAYHDRMALRLWPRAKRLLEDHAKSAESLSSRALATELPAQGEPHPVAARYGELAASLDALLSSAPGDKGKAFSWEWGWDSLGPLAERLRDAAWGAVERAAEEVESQRGKKAKHGFLAASVHAVRQATQWDASWFEGREGEALDALAEGVARQEARRLVEAAESLERGEEGALPRAVEALEWFAGNWRAVLQGVSSGAKAAVADDHLAGEAARRSLSQALSWYSRLAGEGGLLDRSGDQGRRALAKSAIGQPALLSEVKRLTLP